MEEKISSELKLTELKQQNLRQTFNQIHNQSSSILSLTLLWKEIEDDFDFTRNSIKQSLKEAYSIQESNTKKGEELQQREKKLEEISKEIELKGENFRIKEKEFEEKGELFMKLTNAAVEESFKEIELKKTELDERCKEFEKIELEQKKFEEWRKQVELEIELKEKEIEKSRKVIEERDKLWKEELVEIKLKEKQLDERCREIELENKKFVDELGLKEKQMEEKSREVELAKMKLVEQAKELEWKEKQLDERRKEIELENRRFVQGFKSKEKQLDERCKEVELENQKFVEDIGRKEKQLKEQRKEFELESEKNKKFIKELESKKKQVEERFKAVELAKKKLEGQSIDLLLKEKQLAERCKEVELQNKKFTEEMKSKQKQLDDRCKEVELRNKRFEEQRKELELKEKNLEEQLKEVELAKNKDVEQFKVLELKEGQLDKRFKKVELKNKRRLRKKHKKLRLKELQFEEQPLEIGLEEKQLVDAKTCVKIEPPGNSVVKNAAINASVRIFMGMDGKALQIFLNKHRKHNESIRNEVLIGLGLSLDPAKLVLDAMEGFYPPHLRKGDVTVQRSCILLLEQLMKLSPTVKPHVREAAMEVAFDWMTRIRKNGKSYLQVSGFLLLLASYGLASAFDADELLNLFEFVAENNQSLELLRALGLADKASGFIKNLVRKKQQIVAVRFICTNGLVEFQPGLFLKEYLQDSKVAARKIRRSKSVEAQVEALNKRIADLRVVNKCIEDYKLESEPSLKILKQQIVELEREMLVTKMRLPAIGCRSQTPILNEKKSSTPKVAAAAASDLVPKSAPTISPALSSQTAAITNIPASPTCASTATEFFNTSSPPNPSIRTITAPPSTRVASPSPTITKIVQLEREMLVTNMRLPAIGCRSQTPILNEKKSSTPKVAAAAAPDLVPKSAPTISPALSSNTAAITNIPASPTCASTATEFLNTSSPPNPSIIAPPSTRVASPSPTITLPSATFSKVQPQQGRIKRPQPLQPDGNQHSQTQHEDGIKHPRPQNQGGNKRPRMALSPEFPLEVQPTSFGNTKITSWPQNPHQQPNGFSMNQGAPYLNSSAPHRSFLSYQPIDPQIYYDYHSNINPYYQWNAFGRPGHGNAAPFWRP